MPLLDTREHGADHAEICALQNRMERLLDDLDKQAEAYANARQVTEFVSDRRKSILAEAFCSVKAQTSAELSAVETEHRARALVTFKDSMKALIRDQLNAETVIANYHVLQTRLDVARSFMAIERAKIERHL